MVVLGNRVVSIFVCWLGCKLVSDDQLSAHELVKFDLGASDIILHCLFVNVVGFHQAGPLSFILGEEVFLLLFESLNVLPEFVVLLLESLDSIVHVRLRLVGDKSFLQAVGN